jgi:hypothetical protein
MAKEHVHTCFRCRRAFACRSRCHSGTYTRVAAVLCVPCCSASVAAACAPKHR